MIKEKIKGKRMIKLSKLKFYFYNIFFLLNYSINKTLYKTKKLL